MKYIISYLLLIVNIIILLSPEDVSIQLPTLGISILRNNMFNSTSDAKIRDFYFYPGANILEKIDKKYRFHAGEFISDQFFSFSYKQKPESLEALKYVGDCMLSCTEKCNCDYPTPFLQQHMHNWSIEIKNIPDVLEWKLPEVMYFHHGLRFQPQKIKDYIKDKDIIDIGAAMGDSAIALSNYTNRRVYSYEISKQFVETAKNLFKTFKIENKTQIFLKGMSDKPKNKKIHDDANLGQNINVNPAKGDAKYVLPITTIDKEVSELNLKVGFIKADVEGLGLAVLRGGLKTIKRDRPVIELASYHSYDEFFGFPQLLFSLPNYLFEFHNENDIIYSFHEVAIFAYPAEIFYPKYYED
ncbi:methyltransferase, FkbM family protein [Trichomonas vaginalis G3]|uniref:Methyltransferase, FkbM family protein n=1 Tax=Trichomonas vaginalis (strain ATCC PRA-98 / G3) TaxID=412133 RepID=A2FHK8_TRIV3|nr:methyltransferase, FKBM family protein family [Trichomonas vaginalis G3]EAX95599.1 methyltransferase, FkbM family protein [Trichomonas vaginalis G3]KAI5511921.1 methyltransferase, FKBM family protein family [Trichomonas vaginalis G3]|eukprot:XP_001308529.1 methyltransferase, FkbM family protein [Trichomonas vaginalis G3]